MIEIITYNIDISKVGLCRNLRWNYYLKLLTIGVVNGINM